MVSDEHKNVRAWERGSGKNGMVECWNGEILEQGMTKTLVRFGQKCSDLLRFAQIGGKRKSGKGQEETCKKLQEAGRGGRTWKKVEILGLEYSKVGKLE